MKSKSNFLTLCACFSAILCSEESLAQSQYNEDALKKYNEQKIIAEYEQVEKKAHIIDKTLPIDFKQVEHTWERHAQRRPYNGTSTASLPLDPAYSTALNPVKKKPVVHAKKTKITTKKKAATTATKASTQNVNPDKKPTKTPEMTTNSKSDAQKTNPFGNLQEQNSLSNKENSTNNQNQTQSDVPFNTLNSLENSFNNQNLTEQETKDTALRILRTTDNTLEALEKLLEENPKLQEEVKRLRLNQEAAIKDELDLPIPGYVEIVN